MSDFDPNMSPAEFFENVVPALAAEKKAGLTEAQIAVSHSLAIVLTGDGGGSWTINAANGDLNVTQGVGEGANPVVQLNVDHWRQVMSGERAALGGATDFTNLDTSALKPELLERLAPINGTLKVIVEDDDDDMEAIVKFGANAPDEPSTTISTDGETTRAIQSGAINAQMAFMQGKVKILGDMNLAMQVATLQM